MKIDITYTPRLFRLTAHLNTESINRLKVIIRCVWNASPTTKHMWPTYCYYHHLIVKYTKGKLGQQKAKRKKQMLDKRKLEEKERGGQVRKEKRKERKCWQTKLQSKKNIQKYKLQKTKTELDTQFEDHLEQKPLIQASQNLGCYGTVRQSGI